MIRRHPIWLSAALFLLCSAAAKLTLAIPPDLPSLPSFSAKDRILVLAPHEDDETLGTGGILQEAVSKGAAVRIVYLTYGDHNELAFLLYRKRLWLSPDFNKRMGELRRQEAIAAMGRLGIPSSRLVFLGYPDGGTLEIWRKHWGASPPLVSRSTHTIRVPYTDASSYNEPHKGESIVSDLERQLLEFRPTHIFVSHPVDSHPDHRSFYLFLQVALLNLEGQLPTPEIFAYPTHLTAWPHPYGYHPNDWLALPKSLSMDENPWWTFLLNPEQVRQKHEAIRMYKTQAVDSLFWLSAFARRNELFMTPSVFPLQEEWSPKSRPVAEVESSGHVEAVVYRQSSEGFVIQTTLRQPLQREMGLTLYAFGYKHSRPFSGLPKLHLEWTLGRVRVFDQGVFFPKTKVHVETTPTQVTITIPWDLLGEPDLLFAQAKGFVGGIPTSQTSWRLLIRIQKQMENQGKSQRP